MTDLTKLARSAFLALALLVLAPFAGVGGSLLGVGAAQAATVTSISVSGNQRVDRATVIQYLTVEVGENATPQEIDASIDALTASGLFRTVSVTQQGGTLVVRVTENAVVASVLFEGNQRFTDANLVAMIDLMNRGTIDDAALARDVQQIRGAYEDAGYTDVGVSTRIEPVDGGRSRVVFVINEGGRSGIAAINFTGNNSISGWNLKSIIRTHESSWLSWLLRDDNYTQAQLDLDRELIRQYYTNHGFPDAQVTSAVAEYSAERRGYFITFTINEGQQYSFGAIGIETSIAGLDANALSSQIRTREGNRFSAQDLDESTQDIAVEAANLGYAFADVRSRVDRDPASGTLAVTYLVDQGQRIYVERINITGNDKTRDFVIRRELPFAEGDPFSRALVTQGKSRVEALGFFSSVAISAEGGSASDKIIINIKVTETSTGDYGVSAGYDSEDGILGELSITERNFLGRGQYVKATLGASSSSRNFDFSFTEPYFMGLQVSSGLDVYYDINDETDDDVYGTTKIGGQVRLGLPVTRDLNGQIFVGLGQTTIADASDPQSVLFNNADTFNKAWGGYTLTYSTLDSTKKPTEGLYATLTQQYVGWDYNFLKTEAKARYYVPLNQDAGVVGSIRLQGGVINDFSGNGVNALETFKYGQQIVRGLNNGETGPASGDEWLGYTAYAAASAEIGFPIPMLPETYGLSGAIWADAAYIDGSGSGASADAGSTDQPFKSSAGGSIIWDSPFGPLRGDMGVILSQATTDGNAKLCSDAYCPFFQLSLQNLL